MRVRLEQDYRLMRAKAYPPLEDLAEAIEKDDPAALAEYRAKCSAVRTSIPKPEDMRNG